MAQVRFKLVQQVLTATLAGEIDHHSSQQLRESIDAEILSRTPRRLILDFGGVTFMDSSGVGLILGRNTMMKVLGGQLSILNPPAQVARILKLAQISVSKTEDEVSVR